MTIIHGAQSHPVSQKQGPDSMMILSKPSQFRFVSKSIVHECIRVAELALFAIRPISAQIFLIRNGSKLSQIILAFSELLLQNPLNIA
jgi:hypothetical protein